MKDIRAFLAECTQQHPAANVSVDRLALAYARWAARHGREGCTADQVRVAMGYAGHHPRKIVSAECYEGFHLLTRELYESGPRLQEPGTPVARDRSGASHLSSLGMAGLHLEMVSGLVNSMAARAATDRSVLTEYDAELENQSIARDAFRAELERVTGLPADLIERRLAL